jgi:hypothetical protein
LVDQYVTGTDPGLLNQIKIAIDDLLRLLELRWPSAAAFYSSVFLEKLTEADRSGVRQEQWDAIATVAAAHEIVGEQR